MGNSKWDEVIRQAKQAVLNTPWNGSNTRYSINLHITSHCSSFNEMTRAEDAIAYETPNNHTRVQHLLNSIHLIDICVISTTTIIVDNAKRNNFEEAADFLLLAAPPVDNKKLQDRNISSVDPQGQGNEDNSNGFHKVTKEKTGVELRYYKRQKFLEFPKDQKDELEKRRNEKGLNIEGNQ